MSNETLKRKRTEDELEAKELSVVKLLLLEKVISGGQTGADRAGLEAAREAGLETGGWAPFGFKTANGADLTLQSVFGLQQCEKHEKQTSLAQMYIQRSMKNVDASDATIAFRLQPSTGTDKTIGYCQTKNWQLVSKNVLQSPHRICCVITDISDEKKAVEKIIEFISKHNPKTINICGHRDDKTAGQHGFTAAVKTILFAVFNEIVKGRET